VTLQRINLECPSGLAANLFATTLITVGVPAELLLDIPHQLGLPKEFRIVHDGYAYDGLYTPQRGVAFPDGSPSDMQALVRAVYPDGAGERIAQLLHIRYLYDKHKVHPGEGWCDTLFDASAAVLGLKHLGYPKVTVHGPLPVTGNLHPVSHRILNSWLWKETPYQMELVTPTAAAILHEFATQTMRPAKGIGVPIQGAFTRRHDLPPLIVYLS
jgi:uncharacterized protein (DUF111 family)